MSNKLNRKSKGQDKRDKKKGLAQAIANGGKVIMPDKPPAGQAFVDRLILQLQFLEERKAKFSLRQLWGLLDCLEVVTDSVRRTFVLTTAFSQGLMTQEEIAKDPEGCLKRALDIYANKIAELPDDKKQELLSNLADKARAEGAKP